MQDSAAVLDFERLDVYRLALEFKALASSIALPAGRRELRDQLDRAALSIVLNTAGRAAHYARSAGLRLLAWARPARPYRPDAHPPLRADARLSRAAVA